MGKTFLKIVGIGLVMLFGMWIATQLSKASIESDSTSNTPFPIVSVDIIPSSIGTPVPNLVYLPDCEDSGTFPCVTWDESEWRMVSKPYPNYEYVKLNRCNNEDGGILPCVYVSKRTDIPARYLVWTMQPSN